MAQAYRKTITTTLLPALLAQVSGTGFTRLQEPLGNFMMLLEKQKEPTRTWFLTAEAKGALTLREKEAVAIILER